MVPNTEFRMHTALVVTSINPPNTAMRELAAGCVAVGWNFIVAGDGKSPPDYSLEGCRFLSLDAQRESGFALGRICPERSYTRKNIGYLTAMRARAKVIVETDDDNHSRGPSDLPTGGDGRLGERLPVFQRGLHLSARLATPQRQG